MNLPGKCPGKQSKKTVTHLANLAYASQYDQAECKWAEKVILWVAADDDAASSVEQEWFQIYA